MKIALTYGEGIFATGVKRYADSLVAEFAAMGVDAHRVALKRREMKVRGRVVGGYLSVWAARFSARPKGFDLVHALDPSVAARGTDITTVHDLVAEMFPDWYQTTVAAKLDQRILRASAKRSKWFIADTEATKRELILRWGIAAERIFVVHLGIDPQRFQRTTQPSELVRGDKPTLVLVGDDNPRKNVELAVRATAALRDIHGIDARLVRIGAFRWPIEHERYQRAAGDLKVDLVEPGGLDDDALIALLSNASALLWPSIAEGFGIPPLEAMACGAPVVALDTPVNKEVCGPLTSYHANEPHAAADAIARVLKAPPLRDALRAYASGFSWRKTAERTLAVYDEVMRR